MERSRAPAPRRRVREFLGTGFGRLISVLVLILAGTTLHLALLLDHHRDQLHSLCGEELRRRPG